MIGAIIGDMVGSLYEGNNIKDKRFFFLTKYSLPTDDTIMTIAISKALCDCQDISMDSEYFDEMLYKACINRMVSYGKQYPDVGYGGRFKKWLNASDRKPYESYGNGSAMRVAPVGWFCDSLEDTLRVARITALPTHNHPEGIKGAQAVSAGIFLLRTGKTKEEVKQYISDTFGYDLDRRIDDIRPSYTFHVSCQRSVPEAIIAFLEGTSYEDVVRTAVSIGGDSDTIACIAGSLAEVIYPIPAEIRKSAAENLSAYQMITNSDLIYYNSTVLPKKNKSLGEQKFDIRNNVKREICLCTEDGRKIVTNIKWNRKIRADETLIVTKGFGRSLFMMSKAEFVRFNEMLMSIGFGAREQKLLKKIFIEEEVEVIADAEGQVMIPSWLLEHAEITSEAVIKGVGDFAQVWSGSEEIDFVGGIEELRIRLMLQAALVEVGKV